MDKPDLNIPGGKIVGVIQKKELILKRGISRYKIIRRGGNINPGGGGVVPLLHLHHMGRITPVVASYV